MSSISAEVSETSTRLAQRSARSSHFWAFVVANSIAILGLIYYSGERNGRVDATLRELHNTNSTQAEEIKQLTRAIQELAQVVRDINTNGTVAAQRALANDDKRLQDLSSEVSRMKSVPADIDWIKKTLADISADVKEFRRAQLR